jgi:hypothetical protein
MLVNLASMLILYVLIEDDLKPITIGSREDVMSHVYEFTENIAAMHFLLIYVEVASNVL